jgi:membrane protein
VYARGAAAADRARDWVARQDATTRRGVGFVWWRRYRSIDGPLQSLLLTLYVFLAVLPATLVLVEYVQRNPAALADELVHGYGLKGSAAGLLRGVLVGDRTHEFGSALFAIATALLFGLGYGRVLQLVHARAWQLELEAKAMDQLRYAAVLLVLFGLLLLVLVEEKLFAGWSSWLDAGFAPAWIALLVGYFVWAPRMLTHKRLRSRDLLPGAVLTALGLVALMFLSSVAMASWVDLYATDFAGLGVIMALFFWLGLSSTVIVAAASLSPSLAERREVLRT